MKYKLYEDHDGTIYEIESLTSNADTNKMRQELGIPDYVNLDFASMSRTVVTLWAAYNILKIRDQLNKEFARKIKEPIKTLVFGGIAVKLLSPTANKPESPLNRNVKDVDFIVPKKEGSKFTKLLVELSSIFGTKYLHFISYGERMFNAFRGGTRYRVRGIIDIVNGEPIVGITDIFCDELVFRHTINVKNEFQKYVENVYTIGVENMLLAKTQYIFSVLKSDEEAIKLMGQSYRILNYPCWHGEEVIVGMEPKDMIDVAAILLDYEVDKGERKISSEKLNNVLKKDKKFALTFRLNIKNLIEKTEFLRGLGLSELEINKIISTGKELLSKTPEIRDIMKKPWWNPDVETPQIRF